MSPKTNSTESTGAHKHKGTHSHDMHKSAKTRVQEKKAGTTMRGTQISACNKGRVAELS